MRAHRLASRLRIGRLALLLAVAAVLGLAGHDFFSRPVEANPAQVWVVNEHVASAVLAASTGTPVTFTCTAADADAYVSSLDAIQQASAMQVNADTAYAGASCIIVRTDGSTTGVVLNGRGLVCAVLCDGSGPGITPTGGSNGVFATNEITANGTFTSGNTITAVQDSVAIDSAPVSVVSQAQNMTLSASKGTVQESATSCPVSASPTAPTNGAATATYTDVYGNPLVGYAPTFASSDVGLLAVGSGTAFPAASQQRVSMLQPDGTTVAAVDVYCGVAAGVATLSAASAEGELAGVPGSVIRNALITVTGVPATIDLSASPAAIPCDGSSSSTVTATVKDSAGNNVVDGTGVTFSVVALGTSNPVNTTTSGGVATSMITPLAGATAGVIVSVTSGDAAVQIRIDCLPEGPDMIDGAIIIDHLPFTAVLDTTGFTTEPGEPLSCGGMGATAWFAIELPTAGPPLTVDTFGSNFSTALAVYTPAPLSPPGGLAPLGCNATPGGSALSFVPAGPGAYYIQAGGAGGASGSLTLNVRCTHDLDCDGLSDSDEAALGTSPTVADSDGDGLSDGAEVHIYGSDPLATDTDGDHCGDGREIPLGLDPTNKWDFYSVPVPALTVAPNPVGEVPDKVVSAGDAQAVFAYFKVGAVAGSQVYEQDLNQNGIKDGLEYDRTSAGAPRSGPPDGAIGAVDAQIAFAQFRAGFAC